MNRNSVKLKHDWDDAGDGRDDKNRVQMTNDELDDTNDSGSTHRLVTSRSTEHLWHAYIQPVTRSTRSQVSGNAKYAVRWQTRPASDLERVKRIGYLGLRGKAASRVPVPLTTEQ